MLYSNQSVQYSPAYPGDDTNYLNINFGFVNQRMKFTNTIKVLISGAQK